MKPSVFFVLLCLAVPSFAQRDSIFAYYDMFWGKVANKNHEKNASYFRVVKDLPDGTYLVCDYYMSGALQFKGICTSLEPKLEMEGDGTLYYESGGVKQVGHFKAEKAVGLHTYYYEDGTRLKVVFHREGENDIYHQFWSRDGEPRLVNGNGLVAEYLPDSLVQYHEIKDSVVVVSFTNDGQEHLIYSVMEQHPEYPGGYGALAKDLQSSLKYPKSARKRGIEGTVYVSFIVDVDGHITEPQVLKGIQAECDAAAVEAVGKLNNWNPGMHDDKPVRVRYVLPIKFNLKGWSLF